MCWLVEGRIPAAIDLVNEWQTYIPLPWESICIICWLRFYWNANLSCLSSWIKIPYVRQFTNLPFTWWYCRTLCTYIIRLNWNIWDTRAYGETFVCRAKKRKEIIFSIEKNKQRIDWFSFLSSIFVIYFQFPAIIYTSYNYI